MQLRLSDSVREQSRHSESRAYMGRFTISGHWSWLVCGHESLEMRSYLGIGSEAVFCYVLFSPRGGLLTSSLFRQMHRL